MLERERPSSNAVIKVLGVGGGGGNAINTMIESGLTGVEFIVANTDIQALQANLAPIKIQLGRELTKGLGAGANPQMGRDAALEDKAIIQEILQGADMVFITAGMGGGTGTGAAPIIAQVARELGALTVGVVTKPFAFEGKRRRTHGDNGIQALRQSVDTLITIPNQRLLSIAPSSMSMLDGFKLADEVLLNAVKGISDIINIPGRVNVDFADVRTIMAEMGMALMGIGSASGPNRAVEAARHAINSPLLEEIDIEGATGILINITGSNAMTLHEISEASTLIQEAAHEDANIIFGAVIDESLGDTLRVTVIATGFDRVEVPFADPNLLNYGNANQMQQNTFAQNNPYGAAKYPQNGNGQNVAQNGHQNLQENANLRHPGLAQSGYELQNQRMTHPNNSNVAAPKPSPTFSSLSSNQSYNGRNDAPAQRPAFGQNNFGNAPLSPFEEARRVASLNPNSHQSGQNNFSGHSLPANALPSNGNAQGNRNAEAVENKPNKPAFEDLTQLTFEMARDTAPAPTNASEVPSPSVPVDPALQLAQELSEVKIDETDFETPAYLRKKEDPFRNI